MEKVYLLLRKNQQTGPYTYEELLQQQLLPTDLIWVEGRSTAWINPDELKKAGSTEKAAKPTSRETTIGSTQKAVSRDASVIMPWYLNKKTPEAELEERAMALRERAQTAITEQVYRPSPIKRSSQRQVVYQEEESPILLEVHTINKKSVTLPQLIAAGVITALVAAGWYNREVLHMVRPQQNIVTQAAAPAVFQISLPTPPTPALVAVTDTNTKQPQEAIQPNAPLTAVAAPRTTPTKKPVEEVKESASRSSEITILPAPSTVVIENKEETKTAAIQVAPAEKIVAIENSAKEATTEKQEVSSSTGNKKKGLGQALKNIFKKKKKGDDDNDENVE